MFKWQRNFSSGSLTATIKAIIANLLICEKHCLLERERRVERREQGALGGAKWSAARLKLFAACVGVLFILTNRLLTSFRWIISLSLFFLSRLLSLYLSLGHCYKQLPQLMIFIALSSSVSDSKIVFSNFVWNPCLTLYQFLNINSF